MEEISEDMCRPLSLDLSDHFGESTATESGCVLTEESQVVSSMYCGEYRGTHGLGNCNLSSKKFIISPMLPISLSSFLCLDRTDPEAH